MAKPSTTRGLDVASGEITCADCLSASAEIAELKQDLDTAKGKLEGAERDLNVWRLRYRDLKRDKEAEAREHELFDTILGLFDLWRWAAGLAEDRGKPKGSKFTAERFWLAVPFYKTDGLEMCQRAIIGRCADHYVSTRPANGSKIHYLEFERIFGSMGAGKTARANFEESANRAPKDWRQQVEAINQRLKGGR